MRIKDRQTAILGKQEANKLDQAAHVASQLARYDWRAAEVVKLIDDLLAEGSEITLAKEKPSGQSIDDWIAQKSTQKPADDAADEPEEEAKPISGFVAVDE